MSKITAHEAIRRLRHRWQEQVRLFPTMEREIPLSLYLHANLSHVVKHGLLADYHSARVEGQVEGQS